MSAEKAPEMPRAQIIYGEIVYWVTIVACLICMIGPVISVANPEKNKLNPFKLFDAIFQGKSPQAIWQEVGGGFPGGHFYLKHLTYGDGFTQLGLALGCSVAVWALIATALVYIKEKNFLYMGLALWVGAMVFLSMIGIVAAH